MDPCLDQGSLQVSDCKTGKRHAAISLGQNIHDLGRRKKYSKGKTSRQFFIHGF